MQATQILHHHYASYRPKCGYIQNFVPCQVRSMANLIECCHAAVINKVDVDLKRLRNVIRQNYIASLKTGFYNKNDY